jgi:hypothetical protein
VIVRPQGNTYPSLQAFNEQNRSVLPDPAMIGFVKEGAGRGRFESAVSGADVGPKTNQTDALQVVVSRLGFSPNMAF